MRERLIRFTAEGVCAYLDGRKTQARVPVKVEIPDGFSSRLDWLQPDWLRPKTEPSKQSYGFWLTDKVACVSPFGGPGDRLWVQETWEQTRPKKSGERFIVRRPAAGCGDLHYAADNEVDEPPKWRPSIYMPRWASRINLDVTEVRVEQLQDITEADALAEGVHGPNRFGAWRDYAKVRITKRRFCATPVASYQSLWDSIYAKWGYGWDANPWVWVGEWSALKQA